MNQLEIAAPFILVILIAAGWFITEYINKKSTILSKLHWSIYIIVAFILFAIIAAPMFAFNIHYVLILICSGGPLCFMFGVSVSMILLHCRNKKDKYNDSIMKNNKKHKIDDKDSKKNKFN